MAILVWHTTEPNPYSQTKFRTPSTMSRIFPQCLYIISTEPNMNVNASWDPISRAFLWQWKTCTVHLPAHPKESFRHPQKQSRWNLPLLTQFLSPSPQKCNSTNGIQLKSPIPIPIPISMKQQQQLSSVAEQTTVPTTMQQRFGRPTTPPTTTRTRNRNKI